MGERYRYHNSMGNAVSITDFLRFKETSIKNIEFKRSIVMTNIRFNNLPKLLNSMRTKGWVIDSFLFNYKQSPDAL
ncbi:MAG: DUF6037 family protein [Streptococcus sp.]